MKLCSPIDKWNNLGDKPSFKPMTIHLTDTYMHYPTLNEFSANGITINSCLHVRLTLPLISKNNYDNKSETLITIHNLHQ